MIRSAPTTGVAEGDVYSSHPMSQIQIEKICAETDKLIDETRKINAEGRWFPLVVVAGIFAAAFGFIKLLE